MKCAVGQLIRIALLVLIWVIWLWVLEQKYSETLNELEIRFGETYLKYKSTTPMLLP